MPVQSEKSSVSTHDATGFKETLVLNSEELIYRRSDSVGSSSHEHEPRVDLKPASTGHEADADSSPAPSQLRPSPKQAGEHDTLGGNLKARTKELPADARTESKPMTRDHRDHPISKVLKDPSSALPRSQNASTHNATSSSSKAGRSRHVSNSRGWASIISFILLGLFIAGIGAVCVADLQFPSVGMRKSVGLASQACLGVSSAYAWILYTAGMLYQRLPALQAPRPSSREEIGSRLGEAYTGLSQALVARTLLRGAPELLMQKRGEAMRFRLPEDSLILKDLRLFQQQTFDADDLILFMMLRMHQVSRLALRQQSLTRETLSSIQQRDQYWSTFGPFPIFEWLRIYSVGTSTQEAQLQTRLQDHVELMYENIIDAEVATHKV